MRVFFIPIIKWLSSLTWSDFGRIVTAVEAASDFWQKSDDMTEAEKAAINASRADQVRAFMGRVFPKLSGWRMNVAMELAVAWFNRTKK